MLLVTVLRHTFTVTWPHLSASKFPIKVRASISACVYTMQAQDTLIVFEFFDQGSTREATTQETNRKVHHVWAFVRAPETGRGGVFLSASCAIGACVLNPACHMSGLSDVSCQTACQTFGNVAITASRG